MTVRKVTFGIKFWNASKCNARLRSTSAFVHADAAKTTIDQDEVSKLSKLSSVWWDENGSMAPLHSMNKLRVPLIRDCLLYSQTGSIEQSNEAKPLKGYNIIDIGCGGGILSEPLARIGANVTGLDASEQLIEIAVNHAKTDGDLKDNLNYICGSIEEHALKNAEFYDAVVASEVIEHVVDKELFIDACSNVIKPGGSIFITSLNKTMFAWVTGVMAAEYLLHLVPKETHDWEKFISPQQLQYTMEKHGCYTKLVHGMFYNFICNEWFWTRNISVNYALHAVKKK